MYLQSVNMEAYGDIGSVHELLMPVTIFWEIEKVLKDASYMIASGEPQAEVITSYKKIFKLSAPYAVHEKSRTWLHERSK